MTVMLDLMVNSHKIPHVIDIQAAFLDCYDQHVFHPLIDARHLQAAADSHAGSSSSAGGGRASMASLMRRQYSRPRQRQPLTQVS